MKWLFFSFICLLSVPLWASLEVRISDPNTFEPTDLPEVMVGTYVSLVVASDSNDFRSGGLFIKGDDRAIGQLQARGKDPNSRDWAGSHFAAAGPGAHVLGWKDSLMWGFDFYPDDFAFQRKPGKWFVIDYYALDEGLCDVGIYDHSYSWTKPDPNVPPLLFANTPTRDISPDGYVNYADFAEFARYWLAENCGDPNSACYKADFSRNGSVGLEDVVMFANFWLHGNPGWKPPQQTPPSTDPNTSSIPEPNIVSDLIYAIVDVNSLSEITLPVGQSVELYITKSSIDEETYIFHTEVNISDPNLGFIDNIFPGTAQIWAAPRLNYIDYIGPGSTQSEGIEFLAVSLSPMMDGDMASFIYTPVLEGDVTLHLIDYTSSAGKVESITIHQTMPIVEKLQNIYDETPELQMKIPEPEWNEFIESVQESEPN
jgi:hypothetical protein